jgi:hypothetical protein
MIKQRTRQGLSADNASLKNVLTLEYVLLGSQERFERISGPIASYYFKSTLALVKISSAQPFTSRLVQDEPGRHILILTPTASRRPGTTIHSIAWWATLGLTGYLGLHAISPSAPRSTSTAPMQLKAAA